MSITRDFKLSLVAGRSVPLVINANQYDDGEIWRFTLLDENGQKYSPSTGSIIGLKSDGHIIANAGTVSSTGLVIIAETEQMTASPGKNFYELLIDDDTHGTANFVVFVEPRPGAGGTPSDSDLAMFQEAIDAAATIGDVADLVDDVDVLEARMDEFARLPDGSLSTAADAELVDIRVGADGTTYPNAGDAVRGQVSDLKNAINDVQNVLDIYVPPTASGTTPADNNANPVLTGLSLIAGHSYRYEVEYETASDAVSYLSWWMTGNQSYSGVVAINAGATSGYGTINPQINVSSAYLALTTGGRALKYTVKFTDLSITTNRIDEIEDTITDNKAEAEQQIEDVKAIVGEYVPPTATGEIVNGDGNKTILDNLKIVENRKYQIDLSLNPSVSVASYLTLWDGTSESYSRVWTISSGETNKSIQFVAGFSSETAFIKLNTSNRATEYIVSLSDISNPNYNAIETNANNIAELEKVSTVKAFNTCIDKDITSECSYNQGQIDQYGRIVSNDSAYVYTSKISVSAGDIVYIGGYPTNTYGRIVAFLNGTAIPSASVTYVRRYVVPSGVNQIAIVVASNINRISDLINIKSYSETVNSAQQTADITARNVSHTYAKRTPMITFIDDDGNVECYTDLFPIFKRHGIPLVSAYMGDSNPDMASNSALMTAEQCREIVQAGGEITVHYNPSLTDLTLDEAEEVVCRSQYYLAKHGFYSRLLVYSNGTSNSAIRAMVSKHFDAGFSGAYPRVSNTDRSNHGCIVQYAIHREPCGGLYYDSDPTSRSLQYFKDMIDECIASNGWLVFTMHSWLMPEGKKKQEYADTDQLGLLEDIIEYIEEKQQGGSSIKVVTASEGLDTFGNAWQAGDYLGYWNEQTLTNVSTIGDHSEPGCAINKLGQYDFPSSNNLNT